MSDSEHILAGVTLGLSLSESPDIKPRGFSDIHFKDIFIEFSRYMLACGATLAYGGDFRKDGFTEQLFDLKATYKGGASKIVSYLGWPIWVGMDELTDEEQLRYMQSAVFEKCPIPDGVDESIPKDKFLVPDKTKPDVMFVWARSMTKMRHEFLAAKNDAQIMLGGRMNGYSSKYPGVVEEAYEIMKAGKPLFLIGAFGGAAGAVIDAVSGNRPDSLTAEGQYKGWEQWSEETGKEQDYRGLVEYFNDNAAELNEEPIDYTKLTDFFNEKGIAALNNNLDEADNRRLFETPHVAEMIALCLKGLSRIKA